MTSLDKTIVGAVFILGLVVGAAAQDVYRQKERDAWINSEWGKYKTLRQAKLDHELKLCKKNNNPKSTLCENDSLKSYFDDLARQNSNIKEVANKIK